MRIRDVMDRGDQPGTETGQPDDAGGPVVVSEAPASRSLVVAPSVSAVRPLYTALLDAVQDFLDLARHQAAASLGRLPELIQQAVDRITSGDQGLFELATSPTSGFSLASHSVNVAILSVSVGAELQLSRSVLADIGLAACLHDVGMLSCWSLLHQPAALNAEDRAKLRQHPVAGHRLLQQCPELPQGIRQVVLQEHERVDGSGYPSALHGSQILPHAQLIGLLDFYEALMHDRPHRPRKVPADAVRSVVQEHRQAFRSELLRAFLETVPVYPVGSWVQLNSGALGRVASWSRRNRLAPVVDVVRDACGVWQIPDPVDLSTEPSVYVLRPIPDPLASPPG